MFYKIIIFFSLILYSNCVYADANSDQWRDSDKTYYDLIQEGFEVKGYNINSINSESGLILMFFVTVLQKNKKVYECQEYQTFDSNMQTLDMTFICRELVQPYQKGIGT